MNRIIDHEECIIGALPAELERGFQRAEFPKGGEIALILSEMCSEARAKLMNFLKKYFNLNGEEVHLEIALDEIIMNTVDHGNNRQTYLEGVIIGQIREDMNGDLWFVIEAYDQGEVFDLNQVPECTDPEQLEIPEGRGLKLIEEFSGFEIEPPQPVQGGKVMRFKRQVLPKAGGGMVFVQRDIKEAALV